MALALVAMAPVESRVHPQDGPHADVEIEIGEQAVVFDVFMNLVMLDEMGEFPRENPADIHPVEEASVLAGIREYLLANQLIVIDGVEVDPVVASFKVVRPDPENVALFPRTGMRGLNKVHLILEYPLKGECKSVAMRWGAFPPDYTMEPDADGERPPIRLEARLLAEGRLTIVTFTEDEPEFIFHASGLSAEDRFAAVPSLGAGEPVTRAVRLPLLSVVLVVLPVLAAVTLLPGKKPGRGVALLLVPVSIVGAVLLRDFGRVTVYSVDESAPSLTEAEALEVFRPLHGNIYRAFDYRDESEVYDALARSVSGDMLDALYNQVFRSLIMIEEGGAVSSVQDVRLDETEVESIGETGAGERGFTLLARWQVDGVVNHFGHSHWRTNEYLARFGVVETEGGWRISSHEGLEQRRLDTDPFTDPSQIPVGEL